MEKRIIQLLEGQTKITKILKGHDKRFDVIDRKLDEHDKRFNDHDEKFNRVFNKLLDHDQQLQDIRENMATKQELNKVINTLDKFVGLYVKTDQEQVFMGQRIARVESDVEKIKTAANVA